MKHSTHLKDLKEIALLEHVCGLKLSEIDRRAQPLQDRTQDKETWRKKQLKKSSGEWF